MATVTRDAVIRTRLLRVFEKTYRALGMHLWSAALGLFRGTVDLSYFLDVFIDDIRAQLTKAWNEGAKSVGVAPDEMTSEDLFKLESIIENEYRFVLSLAADIDNARTANMSLDKFRSAFRSRLDVWSNRYNEVVNSARVWFGGKARLMWMLGGREKHCVECTALNGVVAWAEEWLAVEVKPQGPPNWALSCGGWVCGCSLTPTDRRRTPRALSVILSIVGRKVRV
jgi:hypothetical protein